MRPASSGRFVNNTCGGGIGARTNTPVHGRSGGIPTKDAVAEVETLDAAADDLGVAFELGELTTIDAGADIEVASLASPIRIESDVAVADSITTGKSGVGVANLVIAHRVSGVRPSRVRCVSARIIRTLVSRT